MNTCEVCGAEFGARGRLCLACLKANWAGRFRAQDPDLDSRSTWIYKDGCYQQIPGVPGARKKARIRAWKAAKRLLTDGHISRAPCGCGVPAEKTLIHIPDVNNPFHVEWFCKSCLSRLHPRRARKRPGRRSTKPRPPDEVISVVFGVSAAEEGSLETTAAQAGLGLRAFVQRRLAEAAEACRAGKNRAVPLGRLI